MREHLLALKAQPLFSNLDDFDADDFDELVTALFFLAKPDAFPEWATSERCWVSRLDRLFASGAVVSHAMCAVRRGGEGAIVEVFLRFRRDIGVPRTPDLPVCAAKLFAPLPVVGAQAALVGHWLTERIVCDEEPVVLNCLQHLAGASAGVLSLAVNPPNLQVHHSETSVWLTAFDGKEFWRHTHEARGAGYGERMVSEMIQWSYGKRLATEIQWLIDALQNPEVASLAAA